MLSQGLDNLEDMNLDVGSDPDDIFHFFAYKPGVKNGRRDARSLCDRFARSEIHIQAWFDVGEARGKVYYERGCGACALVLEI